MRIPKHEELYKVVADNNAKREAKRAERAADEQTWRDADAETQKQKPRPEPFISLAKLIRKRFPADAVRRLLEEYETDSAKDVSKLTQEGIIMQAELSSKARIAEAVIEAGTKKPKFAIIRERIQEAVEGWPWSSKDPFDWFKQDLPCKRKADVKALSATVKIAAKTEPSQPMPATTNVTRKKPLKAGSQVIPPERRTKPISIAEGGRLLNLGDSRKKKGGSARMALRRLMDSGGMPYETSGNKYVFDITKFPSTAHSSLR